MCAASSSSVRPPKPAPGRAPAAAPPIERGNAAAPHLSSPRRGGARNTAPPVILAAGSRTRAMLSALCRASPIAATTRARARQCALCLSRAAGARRSRLGQREEGERDGVADVALGAALANSDLVERRSESHPAIG